MLNDRQLEALGLNEEIKTSIQYDSCDGATYVVYTDGWELSSGIPKKYAVKLAIVNKALRAMLEDYLERLGKWKMGFLHDLWVYTITVTRREKSWLKSRKAILEEALNKTWTEIRRILEDNK